MRAERNNHHGNNPSMSVSNDGSMLQGFSNFQNQPGSRAEHLDDTSLAKSRIDASTTILNETDNCNQYISQIQYLSQQLHLQNTKLNKYKRKIKKQSQEKGELRAEIHSLQKSNQVHQNTSNDMLKDEYYSKMRELQEANIFLERQLIEEK